MNIILDQTQSGRLSQIPRRYSIMADIMPILHILYYRAATFIDLPKRVHRRPQVAPNQLSGMDP